MADQFEESAYDDRRESKRGCGCVFWGCLGVSLVCLLFLVAIPTVFYFGVKGLVSEQMSDEPMAIEIVELPEQEQAALEARLEAFTDQVEAGEASGQIELTAREINALIAQNDFAVGKVFVRVEDGQVGGDISIPIEFLPGGEGRYLNATADFDVSLEGGVLIVTLADATVNGAPLPDEVFAKLESHNLASKAYEDPEAARALRQFESLEIIGDKLILKARPAADGAEESTTDPSADEDPVEPAVEADAEQPEPDAGAAAVLRLNRLAA